METDMITKLLLTGILMFLGILVIGNPPATNKAQAFGSGGEMIAGGESFIWQLKDGKVRQCYGFIQGKKDPRCSNWK